MVTSVSFRPQVTMAAPVVQQAKTDSCKEQLNKIESDVKKNQITDIAAMTERMRIESQLNDSKVDPVKYVEETKPVQVEPAQPSKDVTSLTPKNVTDVIAKFHNGKQMSKIDQSQLLFNQMDMFAANNRILHGLF